MQGNRITYTFHIPGTLAADLNIRWTAAHPMTIEHISAVASNNSDATIKVGDSADDDGFLTATTIGDSGTPAEFDLADWNGALIGTPGEDSPRIDDGDVVVITVDFDGAAGTAAQNVTIVVTCLEG